MGLYAREGRTMSGMSADAIRMYSGKVPQEIRSAVAPLSNDKVWAVFAGILTHESISFTDIKRLFETESPGEITRHLKALTMAGLIERRAPTIDAVGDTARSVYVPTALGRSMMRGLFTSILPQPSKGRVISREFMTVPVRRFREGGLTDISEYSSWSSTDTQASRSMMMVMPHAIK
jgi:DNA-binding transcriptional ArsR family regulator